MLTRSALADGCKLSIGTSDSGAVFSADLLYRYLLWRRWAPCTSAGMVGFIGLNPSTADETTDDPTVRRCIGFAKAWGFDGMVMLNAFAFRATDPRVMKLATDPVGIENDAALVLAAKSLFQIVCCWGNHGRHLDRSLDVLDLVRRECNPMHLGLTRHGEPKHPLYLPANSKRQRFAARSRIVRRTPPKGDWN